MMRQGNFSRSTDILGSSRDFSHLYLGIFSSLRSGKISIAQKHYDQAFSSSKLSKFQKDETSLLMGSIYLENRDYKSVWKHYSKLQKDTKNERVRKKTGRLLTDLKEYESIPKKNLWIAGLLSAILPGTGQVYAEHYTDGIIAFLINTVLIGSAAGFIVLESSGGKPPVGSSILSIIGFTFYVANITGAVQAARRRNYYQERNFHQKLRNQHFNIDYVERVTGLSFGSPH